MACFSCGSPEGSIAVLCPACVEARKAAHAQRVSGSFSTFHSEEEPKLEIIHQGVTSIWVRLAAVACVAVAGSFAFANFGPVSDQGPLAAILFSCAFVCTLVAFTTYFWLWVKMLVIEPFMGLIAFVVPLAIVWYWAGFNPEHAKSTAISHYISTVLCLVFVGLLAAEIHVPFSRASYLLTRFATPPEVVRSEIIRRENFSDLGGYERDIDYEE